MKKLYVGNEELNGRSYITIERINEVLEKSHIDYYDYERLAADYEKNYTDESIIRLVAWTEAYDPCTDGVHLMNDEQLGLTVTAVYKVDEEDEDEQYEIAGYYTNMNYAETNKYDVEMHHWDGSGWAWNDIVDHFTWSESDTLTLDEIAEGYWNDWCAEVEENQDDEIEIKDYDGNVVASYSKN